MSINLEKINKRSQNKLLTSISDCICLDLDSGPLMPAALTVERAKKANIKIIVYFILFPRELFLGVLINYALRDYRVFKQFIVFPYFGRKI